VRPLVAGGGMSSEDMVSSDVVMMVLVGPVRLSDEPEVLRE